MDRIKIQYPEKTIYRQATRVRINDLNTANHLGFDSLVGILNDASAGFFNANGIERGNPGGAGVIYTDLLVNYLKEAFYGETLQIEVAVGDVGSKGLNLLFKVNSTEADKVIALAQISVLFFDYQNRRTIGIPEQFLLRIKHSLEAAGRILEKQEGTPAG